MRRSLRQRIHGHYWTFVPHLVSVLRPPESPREEPWEAFVEDDEYGRIRLTGQLSHQDPERLVVLLHGLGGSEDSRYVVTAAQEASRLGLSTLRANMRGADRSGEDIYHAGLTADVHAAMQSKALSHYRQALGQWELQSATDTP